MGGFYRTGHLRPEYAKGIFSDRKRKFSRQIETFFIRTRIIYTQGNIFCATYDPIGGCFGFDSIRHWTVSTPGVGGLPVNLSFQKISWQQQLCTRCVVYQVVSLNRRPPRLRSRRVSLQALGRLCLEYGVSSKPDAQGDSSTPCQDSEDKLELACLPADSGRQTKKD